MTLYEQKHDLYQKYLEELSQYSDCLDEISDNEKWQWCEDYIAGKACSWHNIFDNATGDLIGFFIICKDVPNCHPDADYSVAEVYLLPEYRKQGFVYRALRNYFLEHPGIVAIGVLLKNEPALRYWRKLIAKLDPKVVKDVLDLDKSCMDHSNGEMTVLGVKVGE